MPQPEGGIAIKFVRNYDVMRHEPLTRMDCLFGFPELYPSWLPWYVIGPRLSWLWRHRVRRWLRLEHR